MSGNKKYCTLDPVFPNKAYLVFLFILHHDKLLGIVPVDSIYPSPAATAKGVTQTVRQFETINKDIMIPEECLIIPLTYNSLYPLKPEFWKAPVMTYNSQTRIKTFSKVYENPAFYSLVVTPYAFEDKKKKWILHAALPVADCKDTAVIEQFMRTSDHIVEPRAKHAAIYSIGEKMRFNWHTKEIKKFDNTLKHIAFEYN